MALFHKHIDCATALFHARMPDARRFATVVVKRSYQLDPYGDLTLRPEQEMLCFEDEYYDEPLTSPLRQPSDIVPFKPKADVICVATSFASNDDVSSGWSCALSVSGLSRIDASIRVEPARRWQKKSSGVFAAAHRASVWKTKLTETPLSLPITYLNAFGGEIIRTNEDGEISREAYEYNPIGCGHVDPQDHAQEADIEAPRLTWSDCSSAQPEEYLPPASFGPIPPHWLPRRALAGTYDQNWIENIRPNWPQDYDFAYHNAAHERLQIAGFLRGDEIVCLENMFRDANKLTFSLPGNTLVCRSNQMEWQKMSLDTLYIDIDSPLPHDWMISLTWRAVLPPSPNTPIEIDEWRLDDERLSSALARRAPADVAQPENLEKAS